MTDQLQAPSFDLIAADNLALSVLNALAEKLTDTKWKEIQQQAGTLCIHWHNTYFTREKADPENSTPRGFYCGGPDRENRDRKHRRHENALFPSSNR